MLALAAGAPGLFAAAPLHAATWFVAAEASAASDRNPGTEARPLKTIGEAMKRLRPGDTVEVGPGVYRETVIVPRLAAAADGSPTVIRAREPGRAIVRGSDVFGGWVPLGDGRHALEWRNTEPAQVFVDGQPLRQVGGTVFEGFPGRAGHELAGAHAKEGGIWPGRRSGDASSLAAGEFTFDAAARRLVLRPAAGGTAPAAVEVAVRAHVLLAEDATALHLVGLVFEHANTSATGRQGALKVFGRDNVVREVVIRHMDSIGLQFFGQGGRVLDSRIEDCGQMGLNARGRELLFAGNRFLRNNHRGFNKWWEAGGVKVIGGEGLHDSVFRDNVFAFNQGDGLWIDWMNTRIRIERNVAAFNTGFGIHYEASQRGVIEGNAAYGNGQHGIYLLESTDSRVERNVSVANGLDGIVIADGTRSRERPQLVPRGNRVADNVVGWNDDLQLMLPEPAIATESDRNRFIAERAPLLVRGWRSLTNRPAQGLEAWRSRTGLDLFSSESVAPRPAGVVALLRERRLVDTAALRALVEPAAAR